MQIKYTIFGLVGTVALALIPTTIGFADQVFHSERLPFFLTPAGAAAGHPELRSGHVIDIHPNGPVNGAHERYMINGAKPDTEYHVVLRIFGECFGTPDPVFDPVMTITLRTDKNGNAQGNFTFPAADPLPEPFFLGVFWTLVEGEDENAVVAYETDCISVGID